MEELKRKIREIPNYPKPGILFYDVTTLLKDAQGFGQVIEEFTSKYRSQGLDKVVGIESRGFILGPALAYQIGAGFVPVRKEGKLPAQTLSASYELEYGQDSLEIHKDSIEPGERILIVDDLIATGGTAAAAIQVASQLGAEIVGLGFLIELSFLQGRQKLGDHDVFSLLTYDS